MEMAARAASSIRETKILSIMLYMACTSMEMIIGRDMVISSRLIGMVPIRFSSDFIICWGIESSSWSNIFVSMRIIVLLLIKIVNCEKGM